MKTVRCIVSGSVQGIGYRAWAKREASRLGLTGWIKNRDDGAVEAVVSGDDQGVDAFIKRARQGPPLAHVVDITITSHSNKETFSSFSVLQ